MQPMSSIPSQDHGCPEAAPIQTTVYTRTLHRACEAVGGVAMLAARLHVSEAILERWLDGDEIPPTSVFLACVDIALEKKS